MQEYKDWLKNLTSEDMPNEDLQLVAECSGMETAISLLQEMGGVTLNIPKLGGKKLYRRYIKEVYDGSVTSMRRIALHLGVTQSYVEKIYRGYLDDRDDEDDDHNGSKFLLEEFGVYAWPDEFDINAIRVTFIPQKFFYIVPEEYRTLFTKLYIIFADWVAEILRISSIFERYKYNSIDQILISSKL